MTEGIRIDKWLWAVRIFKTRNQAGEACRNGKVKISGASVKPSREIRPEDIIVIHQNQIERTVKVKGLLSNRVGAKQVADFMEDLTPMEEYNKLKMARELNYEYRIRGSGRPTKKERRMIDKLKKSKI